MIFLTDFYQVFNSAQVSFFLIINKAFKKTLMQELLMLWGMVTKYLHEKNRLWSKMRGFPGSSMVKNPPVKPESSVSGLGRVHLPQGN